MTQKTATKILGLLVIVGLSAGCSGLRFKSTEEVRAMGEEKYSAEQYGEATPYYDELIRRDEEDVNARLKRARSRDKSGNQLAAREDYSAAIEASPDDTRARIYRAELLLRTGDLNAAEADLTYILQKGDGESYDKVIAAKFMGVIHTRRNNVAGASNFFRQAISLGSGASDPLTLKHVAEAHYNLGQCEFVSKNFASSHSQFVLYSRLAPRVGLNVTPQDYYLLGVTAYLTRDFNAAQTYFAKSDPALRAKAARVLDDPTINGKQFH